MKMERSGGILLHITALPGDHGIGTFGRKAFQFIDFLAAAKMQLWQICPLGPTGFGNSPYQCYSAFAGNTLLIDLNILVEQGMLERKELKSEINFADSQVDFAKVSVFKRELLEKAFLNFQPEATLFQRFCAEQSYWLDDYSFFMALKEHFGGNNWLDFPTKIKLREPVIITEYKDLLAEQITFQKFQQFLFFQQWQKLHDYAKKMGIRIIGDIPIYVAADSADVWTNPELFQLDENKNPNRVAGYPPDAFSSTGQLWGNPLFDWEKHETTNYDWWKDRIKSSLDLFDIVRLDHFLGFVRYWSIPAEDSTAENGEWKEGPKAKIFQLLTDHFGELPIIAEDLGNITADVTELRKRFNFPGMKILQFAFDGNDDNPYLPKNSEKKAAIYTGTHDNETSEGWFQNIPQRTKELFLNYIRKYDGDRISWKMVEAIWDSPAAFAIAPMQDFLGLDNSARFNTPGTLERNWIWRLEEKYLSDPLQRSLKYLNEKYFR